MSKMFMEKSIFESFTNADMVDFCKFNQMRIKKRIFRYIYIYIYMSSMNNM